MNSLEEGALGDPVLAGNLVFNPDGRRRHRLPDTHPQPMLGAMTDKWPGGPVGLLDEQESSLYQDKPTWPALPSQPKLIIPPCQLSTTP